VIQDTVHGWKGVVPRLTKGCGDDRCARKDDKHCIHEPMMGKRPTSWAFSLSWFLPDVGCYLALDRARTQLRECLCRIQLAQPPEYERLRPVKWPC
jgi:hypothetical protein